MRKDAVGEGGCGRRRLWEKITFAKAAVDRGTRCKDEAVGLASPRHRAAGAVRALRARIPCGTHAANGYRRPVLHPRRVDRRRNRDPLHQESA